MNLAYNDLTGTIPSQLAFDLMTSDFVLRQNKLTGPWDPACSSTSRISTDGVCGTTPSERSHTVWSTLSRTHNSVRHIPSHRFDIRAAVRAAPQLLYVLHGHFVHVAELYDHRQFGMSPAEVRATDPSHRVMLEAVFGACLQADHSKSSTLGSATGMFLGICNVADWVNVQRDMAEQGGVYGAHGSDGGAAAGRVSYLLGLKGPCFSVNTACSSSLVALDAAYQNLQLHTCSATFGLPSTGAETYFAPASRNL